MEKIWKDFTKTGKKRENGIFKSSLLDEQGIVIQFKNAHLKWAFLVKYLFCNEVILFNMILIF